jgi:hypothetical protein
MKRFTTLSFLVVMSIAGCKSISSLETIEPQEPPPQVPKPSEWIAARKQSYAEPVPSTEQPKTNVSKPDHAEKHRPPILAGKLKPAESRKKEGGEKAISVTQPASAPLLPAIPWYAIATILGTLFTSILAPIAVEIIRERMAFRRQQAGKQQEEAVWEGRKA